MNKLALSAICAVLTAGPSIAADPATIDWSKVPAEEITLF
ncbi:Uncharacterized protein pbN1_21830 [Aromatoleum bremense]|nr:Uncharacterized protein pbN1_21830 [Aromatoleum bremense]